MKFNKKFTSSVAEKIFAKLKILVLALVIGIGVSYAGAIWAPPSSTPTSGNPAAPINVGSAAQQKSGPLVLAGGASVSGDLGPIRSGVSLYVPPGAVTELSSILVDPGAVVITDLLNSGSETPGTLKFVCVNSSGMLVGSDAPCDGSSGGGGPGPTGGSITYSTPGTFTITPCITATPTCPPANKQLTFEIWGGGGGGGGGNFTPPYNPGSPGDTSDVIIGGVTLLGNGGQAGLLGSNADDGGAGGSYSCPGGSGQAGNKGQDGEEYDPSNPTPAPYSGGSGGTPGTLYGTAGVGGEGGESPGGAYRQGGGGGGGGGYCMYTHNTPVSSFTIGVGGGGLAGEYVNSGSQQYNGQAGENGRIRISWQ